MKKTIEFKLMKKGRVIRNLHNGKEYRLPLTSESGQVEMQEIDMFKKLYAHDLRAVRILQYNCDHNSWCMYYGKADNSRTNAVSLPVSAQEWLTYTFFHDTHLSEALGTYRYNVEASNVFSNDERYDCPFGRNHTGSVILRARRIEYGQKHKKDDGVLGATAGHLWLPEFQNLHTGEWYSLPAAMYLLPQLLADDVRIFQLEVANVCPHGTYGLRLTVVEYDDGKIGHVTTEIVGALKAELGKQIQLTMTDYNW